MSPSNSAGRKPDVSVVVAAWNVEDYLAASVESALSQENVSVEVIVVDDASDDGTPAVAKRLAAQDPRIIAIGSSENAGPSAARNRAIAAATGAWIAVLDADDRFAPSRLQMLLSEAKAQSADVVFDQFQEVDPNGEEIPESTAPRFVEPRSWTLADWVEANRPRRRGAEMPPGYLKPLIRREFLAEHHLAYREALRNSEDYLLIAEILAAGGVVWSTNEIGYFYTRREGSISHRIGPDHLKALLEAEHQIFADRLVTFDDATRKALTTRSAGLEDALACERVIASFKDGSLLSVPRILWARPSAVPLVLAWGAEVMEKRIARFRAVLGLSTK